MAYYRQLAYSFGPPLTRAVKWLIVVTSACFVVTYIPRMIFQSAVFEYPFILFALQPNDVVHGFHLWELVTYLFLHGGWFHIIFNMFALWMFGSELERLWGTRKFLSYYFLTGIGAGAFDVTLNTLFHPGVPTGTIGCSGAIYGLLLAYGMLFPRRPIYLWMIVPIQARWFVVIIGGIEFLSSFSGPGTGISHFAHLGGMLFGFIYLRGFSLPHRWQLGYHDWRRARLRRKFEVYMRKHEEKEDPSRWLN